MKGEFKIAILIALIFFLFPILPLSTSRENVLPWALGAGCGSVTPGSHSNVLVLASPSYAILHRGLAVVPSSNAPIQFQFYVNTYSRSCN